MGGNIRTGRQWRWPYSLLIVAVIPVAAVLHDQFASAYHLVTQEDGVVEWATFWAFVASFSLFSWAVARPGQSIWSRLYLLGLGLGCLLIALEEISWGQRIFGFRPPEAFLSGNFQQELNLHNLVVAGTRKAALMTLLVGFGVLLPLVGRIAPFRTWLVALEVSVPTLAIVPAFLAMAVLYTIYPWQSTGEWVEFMAGMGLLYAALEAREGSRAAAFTRSKALAAWCTPLLLGVLSSTFQPSNNSVALVELARGETRALAADFRSGRLRSRCGVHKRVYSFVAKYGSIELSQGAFAEFTENSSTDPARRKYFLDPWNMAYWIRHECSRERRQRFVFVYSFGPNARRESTDWEVAGDDIGSYVYRDRAAGVTGVLAEEASLFPPNHTVP